MITRFAPSPTGPLHLGHAYSALLAHDMAREAGGRFLLRIEDIDTNRSRAEWEDQIYDDLAWLGISWEEPLLRQSSNRAAYDAALAKLAPLTFACVCNRADIRAALSAPQEQDHGPDGIIYPGTCRKAGHPYEGAAVRIDMARAAAQAPPNFTYEEYMMDPGEKRIATGLLPGSVGDVVLARRDTGMAAYHLAVVVDDAAQGITDVVRGADLADATQIHVLLQHLLGLKVPRYHHHRLIRDDAGKRLAKRDDARAIRTYRDDGATPADIRALVGL